jgi:hypothetical protein
MRIGNVAEGSEQDEDSETKLLCICQAGIWLDSEVCRGEW